MWQKNTQYSHTDVTKEGLEADSSRRQIKDYQSCTKDKDYNKKIQKMVKTNRRCSRMYERRRLQEDPEDGKDK